MASGSDGSGKKTKIAAYRLKKTAAQSRNPQRVV